MTEPMKERASIRKLFGRVVDLPSEARALILDNAAPSGSSVRREVESLLTAHESCCGLLDLAHGAMSTPWSMLADLPASQATAHERSRNRNRMATHPMNDACPFVEVLLVWSSDDGAWVFDSNTPSDWRLGVVFILRGVA